MKRPHQCAILVGGLGTRLGHLTADTPKPLLTCGDRPFLAWVLRELCRFGITECILLAGFKSERVEKFCQTAREWLPKAIEIKVSIEPSPAGTGGAVWNARDQFDESFLVINGDSWVDFNLAQFFAGALSSPSSIAHMLLRPIEDASRYGMVELNGDRVAGIYEKCASGQPGIINCGMYIFDKQVLSHFSPNCSIETDVLPDLVAAGMVSGQVADGYFIDIGVPDDYARSQTELPSRLRRPAVFFDRDGVLNVDTGWVGSREEFCWTEGAKAAVRSVNEAGYHAFIVTNQAGVAKGFYDEATVNSLHAWMQQELLLSGAVIDDIAYCPHHPNAVVPAYRKLCRRRKPSPGMIQDLCAKWNVRQRASVLIGDKDTDLQAAEAANIGAHLFRGGRLDQFVDRIINGTPPLASSSQHRRGI